MNEQPESPLAHPCFVASPTIGWRLDDPPHKGDMWGVNYLALLDVLGYRKAILTNPLDEMVRVASSIRDEARGTMLEGLRDLPAPVQHIVYADSVLLYTEEASSDSLRSLVTRVQEVLATCMMEGVLLRGAVTKGELFVSKGRQTIVGKGLVQAYDLEQQQDWAGAVLDQASLSTHPEKLAVDDLLARGQLVEYDVPFRQGPKKAIAVCWPPLVGMEEGDLRSQMTRLAGQPRGSDLGKHEETLRFFRQFRDSGGAKA